MYFSGMANFNIILGGQYSVGNCSVQYLTENCLLNTASTLKQNQQAIL